MAARKSTHYTLNPRVKITPESIKDINFKDLSKDNIVNYFLALSPEDITSSLIMEVFGEYNGKSTVHHYDTFDVPEKGYFYTNDKGKTVYNTSKFTTTFGIWVFNLFIIKGCNLCNILGYINDNVNKKAFGKLHQKVLYALMENKISVDDYKKFITVVDFVMPWETILSPAQSERLLSCTKEIDKMKKKLIKENQEAVDKGDPATAEKIEKQLIEFAMEYLKDDPALDSYLSGAGGSIGNNFKNSYICKGVVRNPDPDAKQEYNFAASSYIDGINKEEYSLFANSLVGGPYSRSVVTSIGGYWEKLLVAALNTVLVDEPGSDCGTDKYIELVLREDLVDAFMYSYIIKPNGDLEELTGDNIDKYIGKKIKVRSTMYCKQYTKDGHVCHHCAGNFFYRRGNNNAGIACSSIATRLKLTSMKRFHDSTVSTVTMRPDKTFSGI